MKIKLLFSSLIFLLSLSCKKDRTCICTNPSTTYEVWTVKTTKAKAKKACEMEGGAGFSETWCRLK